MRLTFDHHPRELIPVRDFRADHHLPSEFGVALFEPKETAGLGSVAEAGAALNNMRELLLAVAPELLAQVGALAFPAALGAVFRTQLAAINDQVGLRQMEIDFAVAGLEDMLREIVFAQVRAQAARAPLPSFEALYADWLDASVRVAAQVFERTHAGQPWQVQIFSTVYGRTGLVVRMGEATAYVHDPALACPVEGFMGELLGGVYLIMARQGVTPNEQGRGM